jgi:lysozyme family protein
MAILPGRQAAVDAIARKLITNKARYQSIEAQTGVPWYMIAALHMRESDADFSTHLHNGDPLTGRTARHKDDSSPRLSKAKCGGIRPTARAEGKRVKLHGRPGKI